ncbi:DNA-binding protein YbiB [Chitinimonas sp. BJYL2]|uniref:DNA-binding protein YbiB n=1 Tax=Chitinimonas sp. BJYL2 TaxID=2976696 RepID=UPI0022B3435B|nr:DNA-binding protein YbiB [Chitinimonas sp. BJYL2]
MSYTRLLKALASAQARTLSRHEARQLFAAMLDGGIPDIELGALLMALRLRGEHDEELAGAVDALNERTSPLDVGDRQLVVLPSYGGGRELPNLTALLALLLRRFDIGVLIHGELDGHGRVATAQVLRELGILPVATRAQAEQSLRNERMVFVPTGVLAPGLADLLSLRGRLGVRHLGHQVVKLLRAATGGAVLTVLAASHPARLDRLRRLCVDDQRRALLLASTEGEPVADPMHRPELVLTRGGQPSLLFGAETRAFAPSTPLPPGLDARATARWIEAALAGDASLPTPIVNQLACCLYGVGYVDDLNQAKAIVAVELGLLAQRRARAA